MQPETEKTEKDTYQFRPRLKELCVYFYFSEDHASPCEFFTADCFYKVMKVILHKGCAKNKAIKTKCIETEGAAKDLFEYTMPLHMLQ